MSARLQACLEEGVAGGVFPAAAAVVLVDGARAFAGSAGAATGATVFDLASLTKVMATTAACLALWAEGTVEPEMPLARFWPEAPAARAGVTVADLLLHRSGLPPVRPFFAEVVRADPGLLEPDCPPERRQAARRRVVEQAVGTAPVEPPRTRALYSDVGFLVLGELLAAVAGMRLDALVTACVAAPLGLAVGFRRLSVWADDGATIAPTGCGRPRDPAPGQEDLWPPIPARPSRPGEVDDDNAWAMDGVAGHAGLFGTAADVAAFGQAVLEELDGAGRLAPAVLWHRALARDAATAGSTRAFGFDTRLPGDPAAESSAGRYLGDTAPGAVGHLGFTGTSLWIDRARRLVVALCTNRVALGRAETRIRAFRPRFHDAVVETLGLARRRP